MKYFLTLSLFSIQIAFAQTNTLWKGYFSYNTIKDVSQSTTKLFAASENAVFSKNTTTGSIKTTNTIDGLSSLTISSIYHSASVNKTLIGYENGLLIVINESDGSMLKVVDIIQKQLPPNVKKINHFTEFDGKVYVSCDFGIVQFNLSTLQFGDTYFIGTGISDIVVNQTTVFNGYLYAATASQGIKKALLTNPNLVDANQWIDVVAGNFNGITSFGTYLFSSATTGQIAKSTDGIAFSSFGPLLSIAAVDIRANEKHLLITTPTAVYSYNQQLALETQVNNYQITTETVTFSCATLLGSTLYLGTTANGIITTSPNTTNFSFISPSGPIRNNIFGINATSSNLWMVYGGYSQYYDPSPLQYYGLSKYNSKTGWLTIPFSEVDGASNLVRVTVNPNNENQIFVSSYYSGLLKFDNNVLTTRYIKTNSALEPVFATDPPDVNIRIEQSAYDKAGNLWMTDGLVTKALKVLKANGTWQSYDVSTVLTGYSPFGRMAIDKNGTKWMCNLGSGLIAFNETYNKLKKIMDDTDGNLPSSAIQVAAVDNRNQLWIGTRQGLRILSSVDAVLGNDVLKTYPIIILEEGVAQELLYQQVITDIVVDGSNNKWISTADAGVFYVSSNGQQTIYHFTSSNSPLPSNNVNDVDIDPATGEVFFATVNGMVSFKGTSVKASDNLNNVVVYPNPVRPEFEGTVKITGLLDKANVKITDIEGNLVFEVISEGGSIEWDTTAFGKYKVASGVYMIFISAQDGIETKVSKVMIIR